MKKLVTEKGLNPENWRYIKNTPKELVLMHKLSPSTTRTIKKGDGIECM
jgi:hypothetical protein